MTKLFKNSKQVLAFVFAFAVLAVSLFTGSINMEAEACDVSKIDYWDGTKASSFASGTGTETDPYIIKTAEQLAFACLGQTPATSTGKFYKVDDSVKTFVMQPENIVDLDTLLALDSAEAVKNYLTGLTGVKNWQTQFNLSSFNGHFDGNGATIYGLYADTVATNQQDCGLFPQFDGGYKDGGGNIVATTCKNITVKNSYFLASRRLGVITGAAYNTGYGAKIDGKVMVDTAAVINCYLEGNAATISHYQEQGIVAGGGGLDVVEINNVLVKGTYAYDTVQGKKIPVIGATSNAKIPDPNNPTNTIYQTKITNSVFLGVAPYQADHFTSQLCEPYIFSNVVTDQASGEVAINNPAGWGTPTSKRDFTGYITQVTSTGFDFKSDSAEVLDWENTWFMSENGPELRKFHGAISFDSTYETHVWECEDCGLKSPGGVAEHNFVCDEEIKGDGSDVFYCKDCGYTCQHNSQSDSAYDPGNCVTAPGTYSRCAYCDWYIVSDIGEVPGHNFTYVEADPGHCEKDGHAEYWYCAECDKKYASNDKFAAFETAVTDDDLNTGLGGHIKEKDEFGSIKVEFTKDGHWYICEIDGGKIDVDCLELDDAAVIEHEFESARCKECGYICEEHKFKYTGKTLVIGDCFKDEEVELKCEFCGFKTSEVTNKAGHKIEKVEEVKPTDKMEGTKAHYYCDECKAIYADAEGKVSITDASLVIPKVLPDEYKNPTQNPSQGGTQTPDLPQGGDQSTTSPATSDSLVSVLAVAALTGAAFIASRKVRK